MAQKKPVTLAVDIGGTGIKMMLLDPEGQPLTERVRVPTPVPPTPSRMLEAMDRLRAHLEGSFDRVSMGFPGVIKDGVTMTAANLHPKWIGFPLEAEIHKRWKKPVRLANDAAVQGFGAIQRQGVELVITLGTGMGSALFTHGHLCPGLELGHHPWKKGRTYEEYLGREGFKKLGHKRWNKQLGKAIDQITATFNWDHLYIGGGNSKYITLPVQPNLTIVSNTDGLTGGVALWEDTAL